MLGMSGGAELVQEYAQGDVVAECGGREVPNLGEELGERMRCASLARTGT